MCHYLGRSLDRKSRKSAEVVVAERYEPAEERGGLTKPVKDRTLNVSNEPGSVCAALIQMRNKEKK